MKFRRPKREEDPEESGSFQAEFLGSPNLPWIHSIGPFRRKRSTIHDPNDFTIGSACPDLYGETNNNNNNNKMPPLVRTRGSDRHKLRGGLGTDTENIKIEMATSSGDTNNVLVLAGEVGGEVAESGDIASPLRLCSRCGATKNPLWRSGPQGPKSLCNACGIRFKKTQRLPPADISCRSILKRKQNSGNGVTEEEQAEDEFMRCSSLLEHLLFSHYNRKSRCLPTTTITTRHSRFLRSPMCEKLGGRGGKKEMRRVFAEDEEEAAILLMALSCGLVHA